MAYELKEGQGSLFAVKEKTHEKGPDREGKLVLGGQTYRLAGWINQGANGPWLSLKAELPRAKDEPSIAKYVADKPPAYGKDIPDDVPF